MTQLLNPVLGIALGGPEIILILCVVVLLFGAKKLPELARGNSERLVRGPTVH